MKTKNVKNFGPPWVKFAPTSIQSSAFSNNTIYYLYLNHANLATSLFLKNRELAPKKSAIKS